MTKNKLNIMAQLVTVFILGILVCYLLLNRENSNSKLEYGNTGYPKNCRAIIKANYEGWYLNDFTADQALDSINRNCGEFGYSW